MGSSSTSRATSPRSADGEPDQRGPAADLSSARVLLVEDDVGDRVLVTRQLREAGLRPDLIAVGRLADALQHLGEGEGTTLVLLDLGLPDSRGLDTLTSVATATDVPVIVLTGHGDDPDVAVAALRRGAHDYLVKGQTSASELSRAIRYAIERHHLHQRSSSQLLHQAALHQLEIASSAAADLQGFVQTAASTIQAGLGARSATLRLVAEALPTAAAASALDATRHRAGSTEPPDPDATLELQLDGPSGNLGTLSVVLPPGHALTRDQRRFLATATGSIVSRVERIAASAALTTRTRQLDTVHRVAERLQQVLDPAAALQAVAAIVAAGVRDPGRVGVRIEVERHVATHGTIDLESAVSIEVPVTVRGQDIGTVRLAHTDGDPWGPDERIMLGGVAALLGTRWALARADQEHQRDVDRIAQLMQTAPVGLALVDERGTVSFANATALRLLGADHLGVFPWSFADGPGASAEPALAAIAEVRRTGRPVRDVRVAVTRADGSERVLAVNASPLRPSPEGRGLAMSISDVTAERRRAALLETALDREQSAAEELRRVGALKDGFLRAVSHELRTPLASIFGFTETLRDHAPNLEPAQVLGMLDRLHVNAQRLALLLEDLLDVGRITAGATATPNRARHDLAAVVAEIVQLLPMDTHELELDLEEAEAEVERSKVERIVHNLLGNAVRHTPAHTTIRVTTRRGEAEAVLVVEDGGPGIPEGERDRVFEPFVQGERAAAEPSPGTGVGLSLVRQFVELHDGTVELDTGEHGGARFTVTFPDA